MAKWLAGTALVWILAELFKDSIFGRLNTWLESTVWYKQMAVYIVANPWVIPSASMFVLALYIGLSSLRSRATSQKTKGKPAISIEIDKCSWGNSIIRDGQPVQIIEVSLTLNVEHPPVNVVDLQLYMGDERLARVNPTRPIAQEKNRRCYEASYELPTATIYNVPLDKRDKYHLCVVTKKQKWDSVEFSINDP